MRSTVRRIVFILAASSGLIASSALAAEAGVSFNHCEPQLPQ